MPTESFEPARTPPCGSYQQDWDLLALGALDYDVQQEMSVHLRACPACQRSFLESTAVADAISTVVPDPVSPVLHRLAGEPAGAKNERRVFGLPHPPRVLPWFLVAASVITVLLVARQRDQFMGEANGMAEQLSVSRAMLGPLCSRSVHQVEMKSVHPEVERTVARAMWSHDSGLLFVATGLPAPPRGKCYQLWLLRQSDPPVASAGLVNVQADGRALLYLPPGDPLAGVTGFALTDEPDGGSVSSRGRKLLVGLER